MLNKMVLQGRLVRDPETKCTQSGVTMSEFTLAWSEKYKQNETKCFLRCKAWRSTAELAQKYFAKGQEAVVEGQMVTEEWTGQDGSKQSRTICIVDKLHFVGKKSDNPQQNYQPASEPSSDYASAPGFMNIPDDVSDEGLPFN